MTNNINALPSKILKIDSSRVLEENHNKHVGELKGAGLYGWLA